jgi:hypothetical protein
LRIGLVEIGARNGDVFLAAAFDGFVVALLRGLEMASARFSAVAARSRSCAETSSLAKSCWARSLSSFFCSRSAWHRSRLLRRLHFLLAGSGQSEREVRFAHAHAGLVDAIFCLKSASSSRASSAPCATCWPSSTGSSTMRPAP